MNDSSERRFLMKEAKITQWCFYRFALGCSLFNKSALYFTGITLCSSFTDRSLKTPELVVLYIGKDVPRVQLLGVKPDPYIEVIFLVNFLYFSTSIFIIYRYTQDFVRLGPNIMPKICGLGTDYGVK